MALSLPVSAAALIDCQIDNLSVPGVVRADSTAVATGCSVSASDGTNAIAFYDDSAFYDPSNSTFHLSATSLLTGTIAAKGDLAYSSWITDTVETVIFTAGALREGWLEITATFAPDGVYDSGFLWFSAQSNGTLRSNYPGFQPTLITGTETFWVPISLGGNSEVGMDISNEGGAHFGLESGLVGTGTITQSLQVSATVYEADRTTLVQAELTPEPKTYALTAFGILSLIALREARKVGTKRLAGRSLFVRG